jgi:hypothetical protein
VRNFADDHRSRLIAVVARRPARDSLQQLVAELLRVGGDVGLLVDVAVGNESKAEATAHRSRESTISVS